MGSSISQWGAVKVPSTEYYVDKNTPYPTNNLQNGSAGLPFSNIQQAVDDAFSKNLPNITIHVAIGTYPNNITLHQDVNYVIEGAVSGFAILGNIVWSISGNALPISQSGLVLRNCAPNSITIVDGSPISIMSNLVLENSFVFTDILQIGTGVFDLLMSGISTASSIISGPVVSSAVLGNVYVPFGNMGTTNTQYGGYITANKLWASQSQFPANTNINILGSLLEFNQCIFAGDPNITFMGAPGTLYVDGDTDYSLLKTTYTLTNGVKQRLDGGLMFLQDGQTINVTGDLVLDIYQYSTKYIILTGSLTSDVKLTFPLGSWVVTAQDFNFDGYAISFVNGTNSADINTSGLYSLSVTVNSVVIGGSGGGSTGITASQHQTLRQLIHFIDEGPGDGFASGAYKEITPFGSIFPTNIIWYLAANKSQKLVEKIIVWSGVVPSQITWHMYMPDGVTIIHTIIDTFTYVNGIFEKSRLRTII